MESREHMKMLENGEQMLVYVTDNDYKLLQFNEFLKQRYPKVKVGDYCYEALRENAAPCKDCPMSYGTDKKSKTFMNNTLGCWQEMYNMNITWEGRPNCNIHIVWDVEDEHLEKKILLKRIAELSIYDEVIEFDLERDSYHLVYHRQNKYQVTKISRSLRKTLHALFSEGVIHPQDQKLYEQLQDVGAVLKHIQESEGGIYRTEGRIKQVSGEYGWVLVTIVPMLDEGSYHTMLCLVQEISAPQLQIEREEFFHGIPRREEFFQMVDEIISHSQKGQDWCMAAIDIEHFKLFNEWYGYEEGNAFLEKICHILRDITGRYHGIAGYMVSDNYAIFLPSEADHMGIARQIYDDIISYLNTVDHSVGFYPAIGLYEAEDEEVTASSAYDRANIAMSSVKGNYATRTAWYQTEMYEELDREHRVLLDIQNAITNGEITYYLQPQCNIATGKIVGAEALVRWTHPEKGMISPGFFIPILEKNGLIGRIDHAVWEQVCQDLRRFIDAGETPLPVSVNLSRIDIYTMDVVGELLHLTEKYQLDHNLLEVEITESSFSEQNNEISKLTNELHKYGFPVLMDDFGSGYSSLNMLKDVNVDILKIDMNFLKLDQDNLAKGIGIIESVVGIARLVDISVIAEGVESPYHVEVIRDVGCRYAQGYHYHRPMQAAKYYDLIRHPENVDTRGMKAKAIEHIDMASLLKNQEISLSMMDKILGAFVFYSFDGEHVTVEKVNQSYCKMFGESRTVIARNKRGVMERVYPSDRKGFLQAFQKAKKNLISGARVVSRYQKGDGTWIWIDIKLFYLKVAEEGALYYAQIQDITEQKHREFQLERSQKALLEAIHITENDKEFQSMAEENQDIAATLFSQILPGGIIGGYCEEGFPLFFVSSEMISLMGYDSYTDFASATKEQVEPTIYVEDRKQVMEDIGSEYYEGLTYTTSYRVVKKDGSLFWVLNKGRVVRTEDGRLAILSACVDVTEVMERQEMLKGQVKELTELNQELFFLHNRLPGGYHRCSAEEGHEFLYISNRFLEIFGYTRQEIKERFDDKFANMVHPDDLKKMSGIVEESESTGQSQSAEYRMLGKDGYIWVIDQSCYMKYEDQEFVHGMITDVTEIVEMKNKLELLMKSVDKNRQPDGNEDSL